MLRIQLAGFPMEKRLDDIDMKFQPSIDPAIIKDLASLRFLVKANHENKLEDRIKGLPRFPSVEYQ